MPKTADKAEIIIAALMQGSSRREAAQIAGVSERTVYNYMQRPEVQAQYAAARRSLIEDTTESIQRGLLPAVKLLSDTVRNANAGERTRIAAARALLDYGLRYSEIGDFAKRIAAIEKAQAEEVASGNDEPPDFYVEAEAEVE